MEKKIFVSALFLLLGAAGYGQTLTSTTNEGNALENSATVREGENGFQVLPKSLESPVAVDEATTSVPSEGTREESRKAMHKVDAVENIADNMVFYGLNHYENYAVAGAPYGFVRFHKAATAVTTNLTSDVTNVVTGFAANGKFYGLVKSDMDVIVNTYDGETFELLDSKKVFENGTNLRQCCAYSAVTNKAYFVMWGELGSDWSFTRPLVELDLATMTARELGKIKSLHLQTLFCDTEGQLYGLPYNNKEVYKISTVDASVELLGNTDLPFSRSCFAESTYTDPSTGTIYWAVPRNNGGGKAAESYIYTIDPQTRHVEFVCDIPNDEHITGLHTKYTNPAAPAAAHDIKLEDGKFSFTVPTTTYCGGNALTGALTAVLVVDGTEQRVDVTAGQAVTVDMPLTDGKHSINVRIANEAGKGDERILDIFLGVDAPKAVKNLTFNIVGDNALVAWEAPTESMEGGAFDSSKLSYEVVRYPGEVVVASGITQTTFAETLTDAAGYYHYAVTPSIQSVKGETAETESIHHGDVWYPPYFETFEHIEDYDRFTKIVNCDGSPFSYVGIGKSAFYMGNGAYDPEWNPEGGKGRNDYLISPAISLKKGVDYELTYPDWGYGSDKIDVTLDKNVSGNDHYKSLNDFTVVDGRRHVLFNVEADGKYYIDWHICPVDYVSSFTIDDIYVTIFGAEEAPATVTSLTATAGAKGALSNTIAFNAPTKNYNGTDVTEITKINIYRDNDLVHIAHTFDAPAAGAALSWTDTEVSQGMHTYAVVPFNSKGQGMTATVSNWVGVDSPSAPTNIKYHMNENNMMTFSFDPVTEVGAHGGYVDPSAVSYTVVRGDINNYQYTWNTVAGETKETTVVETNYKASYSWQQEFKPYYVRAKNSVGTTSSDILDIVVGKPYAQPYEESFEGGSITYHPWTVFAEGYNYSWGISSGSGSHIKPYDYDGGMVLFYKNEKAADTNTQHLAGPRIAIDGMKNPEFSFYMYHGFEADEEDLVLNIEANINDEGWVKIGSFDYNNGMDGWTHHSVKIPAATTPEGYATANVQIRFNGYAFDNSATICIDNFVVRDGLNHDLAIANFDVEKRMNPGQKGVMKITLGNYGEQTMANYSLVLHSTVDGVAQGDVIVCSATDAKEVKAGEYVEYVYPAVYGAEAAGKHYVYSLEIVSDEDENTKNNVAEANVFVKGSILPIAENLAGEATGNAVTLKWTAPTSDEVQDAIVDGFDDYETFIIDGIGDWQLYDGDDGISVYFSGPTIPNQWVKQAWQVWDPEEAGFSLSIFDSLIPHSGHQYLASWTASNPDLGKTTPTDNWLISSEIVGGSSVKFYYRVPQAGADEQTFHLLYSTTDQYPENFIELDVDSEPIGLDHWTELTYVLPRDAKYFAIQHTNNGGSGTVVFVDDVEYTPLYGSTSPVTFKGYNIYRDNVLVAENVTATTYTDKEGGNHKYNVTAVYAEGESVFSNDFISGDPNGINAVEAGASRNDAYTITGMKLGSMKNMPAGIYIVGGRKVVIK